MRRSALRDNLLRILRTEISYAAADLPSPPATFSSFSIDARPGENWFRLTRSYRSETLKIDATTVDGAAPSTRSPSADDSASSGDGRLHISVIVEVSKGEDSDLVLQFVCSAWPDAMDVEKVFTVRKGAAKAAMPFMGPDFGELDEELQRAVRDYLEERGVNDELAEFLHGYVEGKDRGELVRWLKNIEACVKK
ncbi:uncharacterized protein At2g39795, mitochondrial-like [Asparagus officinalis]|uniref:uncharacterized protein At2g39795, mitochondrial-like n=1 Tax=Asparagus officinalis TaxID=4686 RepID=UPI00098E4A65|nr:uncharacterized protein At2g39795, mitochondrial-like [Asparagus officinalis]